VPAAAAPRVATRSTRRLSEVARHILFPSNIVTTGWADVEAQCAEWGDEFDEWQRGAGRIILGRDDEGIYTATVGGITLSIPRQVAKTFLVGRIIFALCVLYPGTKVLWTAHHTATLGNTFRSLSGFARRKSVAPYVKATRRGSGKEAIEFVNGSVIFFGARSQGFGRGFDEVDVEVFDEAQILDEKALEDMVAATNQSRHPHGALLFYMGTPPRPIDPGEAFSSRRRAALAAIEARAAGKDVDDVDSVFIECSADRNANLDDRKQWAKANPSYPHRTPERSMKRLRKNLVTDDAWRREALGIWDDNASAVTSLISPAEWAATRGIAPEPVVTCYGVRFSIDGASVALAVGVRPADGPVHVEVVAAHPTSMGQQWLVDWLVERWRQASVIVVDGKAGASVLVDELVARKVLARRILTPTTDQVIAAHAGFLEAVRRKTVAHNEQPGLAQIVAHATKRKVGTAGGWAWHAMDDDTDVTPLDAATYAWWAASWAKPPRHGRTDSNRRAVVM